MQPEYNRRLSAIVVGLLVSAPLVSSGAYIPVELYQQHIRFSDERASVSFTEAFGIAIFEHPSEVPLRTFPELEIVVGWEAPVLSRTRSEDRSYYDVGAGPARIEFFLGKTSVGYMEGVGYGPAIWIDDFLSDAEPVGSDTSAHGTINKISGDLARYLGIARYSDGFTMDLILLDNEISQPWDPERYVYSSCCAYLSIDVTPVPEPTIGLLVGLGLPLTVWRRRLRAKRA